MNHFLCFLFVCHNFFLFLVGWGGEGGEEAGGGGGGVVTKLC